MRLRELLAEITPSEAAGRSQDHYVVKIAPSDDSDGDLWPIEEVEWNHNEEYVIIRMGYLEDES